MYIVYKTDNQHSYASRDVIGLATSKSLAIILCRQQALKEGYILEKDQLFNLINLKQTQGYNGEGEFFFEMMEPNKLL